MDQLKQAAKVLGVKVDEVKFTPEFVTSVVQDAEDKSKALFKLAVEKPEEAPTERSVYIRAHVGCFFAHMLENASLNPLNFPEDELAETLRGLLTLYELNNKTGMLCQAIVQMMVLPVCEDKKVSEDKVKALLKKEFEGQKKTVPALANLDFDTQFNSESGQKSYKNALFYFNRIAGIYFK